MLDRHARPVSKHPIALQCHAVVTCHTAIHEKTATDPKQPECSSAEDQVAILHLPFLCHGICHAHDNILIICHITTNQPRENSTQF